MFSFADMLRHGLRRCFAIAAFQTSRICVCSVTAELRLGRGVEQAVDATVQAAVAKDVLFKPMTAARGGDR